MNRLHMLIDLGHVSDESKLEAVAASRDPVVVSHTACRAIADHELPVVKNRNIADTAIRAIGENGGVIGIMAITHHMITLRALAEDNTRADSIAPVVDHIEHVIEVAGIDSVGIGTETRYVEQDDCLAGYTWGIDEDTVERLGNQTPVLESYQHRASVPKGTARIIAGMRDMREMKRNLIVELISRGYSDVDIHKILGGNMLRVYRRVLEGG